MSNTIKDGKGSGRLAEVTLHGLKVDSTSNSGQHVASHEHSKAFQIEAVIDIAATEKTILALMNNSNDDILVVTYLRVMSIGAAATNENAYFNLKLGGTRDSGGTEVTPVNMRADNPTVSNSIGYEGSGTDIVLSGTINQVDRNYMANSMQSYNKDGTLILDKNGCLSITHKGSTAAGKAYCRVSYYMQAK